MKEAVRPGYKQTEVGVIPEDWSVTALGNVCEFENGDRSSNYPSGNDFTFSGIPFINAGHVADGKISLSAMDYITPNSFARLTRGKIKSGDILYCLRGSLGKFGSVADEFGNGAIASSLVIVRPKKHTSLLLQYLLCYFGSNLCAKMIETWASGAAQPNLGVQDLTRFSIALPPSAYEQRTIAAALSDVDALLAKFDQLIAKKRDLKQAAMQQLLIGQTRLPGFSGAWEVKPVFSFSDLVTKGAKPTTHGFKWVDDGVLFLRSECVATDGLDLTKSMFITEEAHAALRRGEVRAGDILMTITGNVGRVVRLSSEFGVGNINQHIARIRFKDPNVCSDFVFHWLSQEGVRKNYTLITTGQAYPQISLKQVRETLVPIPIFEEQTAIAAVLSDMDADITALEARRDKVRALKQGMMQELLTGRIRLV